LLRELLSRETKGDAGTNPGTVSSAIISDDATGAFIKSDSSGIDLFDGVGPGDSPAPDGSVVGHLEDSKTDVRAISGSPNEEVRISDIDVDIPVDTDIDMHIDIIVNFPDSLERLQTPLHIAGKCILCVFKIVQNKLKTISFPSLITPISFKSCVMSCNII